MSAKKDSRRSATKTAVSKHPKGFTDEERAAMKAREARANKDTADGEHAVRAAIAAMEGPDRTMATRLHALIKASAPVLSPRTWYGMLAYAKDGNVVCFPKRAEIQDPVRDVRLQ